ncbi:MAG: nucleotidyltransferase family protein [Caldilineaceae bacterium]
MDVQSYSLLSSCAWRPSEEQQLLLRAALLHEGPALEAWRAWQFQANLDRLPPDGFALLPLLAHNLCEQGLDDPLLDKCQGIHRRSWSQTQLLLRQMKTLLELMQVTNITPTVHSATALALLHYPKAGLRMLDRFQLLISRTDAQPMRTILQQAGWQPQPLRNPWLRLLRTAPKTSQYTQRSLGETGVLQWQLLPAMLEAQQISAIDDTGHPVTIQGVPVRTLSPTELFWESCTHGILALQRYGSVQWIADAAMLLRRAQPPIDWMQLLTRTSQSAVTLRMLMALHCLQHTVEAAVPSPVLAQLQTLPIQPFERWELQLPAHLPPAVRSLVTRWLDRQRHRWQQASGPPLSSAL